MTDPIRDLADVFGESISIYSRAQAIEDGTLVDLSEWGSAETGMLGGYRCPVAVTRAVWSAIEAIPKSLPHQDVRGRAHDVLWMSCLALKGATKRGSDSALFRLHLPFRGTRKRLQVMRVVLDGGDDGNPVVTIGFPEDF